MPLSTENEQLLVASKLIQHYRVFSPVSNESQIQAVANSTGNLELISFGTDGELYSIWPDTNSDTGWSISPLNVDVIGQGAVTSFFAYQTTTGNVGVEATFSYSPQTTYVLTDERWSPGWVPTGQGWGVRAVDVSLGSAYYVVNSQLMFSPGGGAPAVCLSGNISVSGQPAVSVNFQGLQEVFILGTNGALYHVRVAPDLVQPADAQADPEAAAGWSRMVELNPAQDQTTLSFTQITVAINGDGYSQVFAISQDNDLYQIWQDAETTDWNFKEIELPIYDPQNEGAVTEIDAFLTELTVLDTFGVPRAETTVTLWSSNPIAAVVNGRSKNLDAVTPYLCQANAAGKVTIVTENDTLDAPILKVTTDFMVEDEYITIEPNAYIQQQLVSLTPAGLTGATNVFSGASVQVVPTDLSTSTLDAVASGVAQCMSLTGVAADGSETTTVPVAAGQSSTTKYLVRNRNLRGLTYVASGSAKLEHRIDLSKVKEQHWRFIFDHKTKEHRFELMTRDQAATLMNGRTAAVQPTSILDDWFEADWGDVWDTIESVAEFVVTTVVDATTGIVTAIQAQVMLVIDSIQYLYDQTVDLVEQVFDAVEGIFESVGTFFETLFDWFGFLFAWDDILTTQTAISELISSAVLPFAVDVFGAGGTLNTLLAAQLQSFQSGLNASFSAFLNSPGISGNGSILAVEATVPADTQSDTLAGTNLAFSGLMDNVNSVQINPTAATLSSAKGVSDAANPFSTLLDDLMTNLGTLFDDPAFSAAMTYFQAIGDNPDQFLQNALSGLLSTIQGLLNVALNVASAVLDQVFIAIQAALGAISNLLSATLYVPLVSELYTMVTGIADMTILGLFSLMAAIPVTISYKLLFGTAPFADATAVTSFIQSVSTVLDEISGNTTQSERRLNATATLPANVSNFLGVLEAMCLAMFSVFEAALDIIPVPPEIPVIGETTPLLGGRSSLSVPILSWAAICIEWLLLVSSLPSTPAALSCTDADGNATLVWLMGGLSPALDTTFMVGSSVLKPTGTIMRNSGTFGTALDWIVAMVQLGLLCNLASLDGTDAAEMTQAFLAATPGLFKFFRLPPLCRWEPGLIILAAMDVVGDLGASVAGFAILIASGESDGSLIQAAG